MPAKRRSFGTQQMGEERVAFIQTVAGTASIYMNDPAANAQDNTPSVTIWLSEGPGKQPFRLGLGSFTERELDLFKEFFELAMRMARPVCQKRDAIAKEAFETGDDSFGRVYRQEPLMVVRPKARRENDNTLHNVLIDILLESDKVLLDPNKFKNRRTEMDFWSDDNLEMPGPD